MLRLRTLVAALGTVALTATLAGCAGQSMPAASAGGDKYADKTIKIGVMTASDEYWDVFKDAAAAEGINVELVDFSEFTQPNPALSQGDLDMNEFQHVIYLANYNVQAKDTLTPIGSTVVYELALFSKKHGSVGEIPQGGTVGVPNDETNRGRALLVLQSAGLIKLKDGGTPFSELGDIDEAASKVQVKELSADLLANSLEDFDAAVVNNNFIADAGLTGQDAIASDDPASPTSLPYINVFVTREEDKDNPTLNKLVDIYQGNQQVLDGVVAVSGDTAKPVVAKKTDLQQQLADLEDQIRAKGSKG